MKSSILIRPVNSIAFLHCAAGTFPQPIWGARILATNSCISTACFPEVDGPTRLDFGDLSEVELEAEPNFAGVIQATAPDLIISTVDSQVLATMPTKTGLREIKVWHDHPRWPEIVTIGVGQVLSRDEVRSILLPDGGTQSGWIPLKSRGNLFIVDGGIPRTQRNFDLRTSPAVLAAAQSIPANDSTKVRLLTALPNGTSRLPDFHSTVETPSKNLWVFDGGGKALFKIDVPGATTRVLAWRDGAGLSIVLPVQPKTTS